VSHTPIVRRKEARVSVKTFVNLSSADNPSFEIASTLDISSHGARVVTKTSWQPNQQLSVRSIRGSLYSLARVVHCQPNSDDTFVIGIEMYRPVGNWTSRDTKKAN
jgi:hypothetical protein